MSYTIVIEDGPPDSANRGGAVSAVETFDANGRLGGWANEISEAVRNTSGGPPINKDIVGIRIKDSPVGHGRAWMIAESLGTGNSHSNGSEDEKCSGAVAATSDRCVRWSCG